MGLKLPWDCDSSREAGSGGGTSSKPFGEVERMISNHIFVSPEASRRSAYATVELENSTEGLPIKETCSNWLCRCRVMNGRSSLRPMSRMIMIRSASFHQQPSIIYTLLWLVFTQKKTPEQTVEIFSQIKILILSYNKIYPQTRPLKNAVIFAL
jgi:hypothetical protein